MVNLLSELKEWAEHDKPGFYLAVFLFSLSVIILLIRWGVDPVVLGELYG
jgi:hypothetical protein